MDRAVGRLAGTADDPGRLHVVDGIAAQERNVAPLEPGHHGGVQSGRFARLGPRPLGGAQRPPAGADQNRVAAADLDVGKFLPGFEILGIDRRMRIEPLHALEQRHVDQHRPRRKPWPHAVDGVFRAPLLGGGRMAVVDHDLAVAQQGVVT